MLEPAEVLAARRKSVILNERKKIDFKQELVYVKDQIEEGIYKHKKLTSVEFKIMVGNTKLPSDRIVEPIKTSWMCKENKREFFNIIQEWLEAKNYDYIEVYNRRKNFSGFIVSWQEYLEVDPFVIEEEENEVVIEE